MKRGSKDIQSSELYLFLMPPVVGSQSEFKVWSDNDEGVCLSVCPSVGGSVCLWGRKEVILAPFRSISCVHGGRKESLVELHIAINIT